MTETECLALPHLCRNCRVRGSALCRATAKTPLPGLRLGRPRKVACGITLAFEGDDPPFLAVLKSGFLRKETLRHDGQRTIVDLACPGDLVGGVLGTPMDYSLETASNAEICIFEKQAVEWMMARNVPFRRCVLSEVGFQHDRQLEHVWQRGALNSRERVIAFLVEATRSMPVDLLPDGGLVVEIAPSRRDWADLSNTTVETISRTLRYLADKDLVTTLGSGRYLIRNLQRLAYLACLDADSDYPEVSNTALP